MEIEKKRQRKANFTEEEVRCLLNGIAQEKEAIQSKLQGALTARRKKGAWARIAVAVNACSRGAFRSDEEIRNKWKDLKSAVMKDQRSQKKTGGSGPVKETPFKELILHIIADRSNSVSGIKGVCTAGIDTESPLLCLEQAISLENIPEDSNLSESPSCNNNVGDLHNGIHGVKRHFRLSSLSISASTASSSASYVDLEPSETTAQSRAGTGGKVKSSKRGALSTTTEDSTLNSWIQSEIDKNNAKMEFMRAKMELIKSNIEKNATEKELIELKKQKIDLEIQHLKRTL